MPNANHPVIRQAAFVNRANFGLYLNKLGLKGDAVEVGTHRGEFAKQLLETWQGDHLYCVDPWNVPAGYEEQAKLLDGGGHDRSGDMNTAVKTLRMFTGRATPVARTSKQAITMFQANSLDFVYIDGDHRYDMVMYDLRRWFTKLKVGGLLAGHDFVIHGADKGSFLEGVQRAVLDFSYSRLLEVHLVVETQATPWSFYLIKDQPDVT